MTTTMCVSGAVLIKAGEGRNTALDVDETNMDRFINQAESVINVMCRYNFTDAYATLNDDTRRILEDTASNLAAIYVISYDMGGYTSRTEAEDMINILNSAVMRNFSILREKETQNFIVNPSTGSV